MPLLPDEVAAKTFRRRWGRGYDRHQVQSFLGAVASDYGAAINCLAALAEKRTQSLAGSGLRDEIDALVQSVREAVENGRTETDRDAATIRRQAEQAAAITRYAESLRAAAQSDVDAARCRVEDAERRARQTEDAARQRWDVLRIETE